MLQVHTLRAELEDRHIDVDGLDKCAMRGKLDRVLSGIRRPPALLCGEGEVDLQRYEVAQLEPLHDLKTTIGRA